jgi:hypothetical protein
LKVLFMTDYARNAVVHNGVADPGVESASHSPSTNWPRGCATSSTKRPESTGSEGDNKSDRAQPLADLTRAADQHLPARGIPGSAPGRSERVAYW